MILLEPSNRILEDTLKEKLVNEEGEKMLMNFADFDGVSYKLSTPTSKTCILLSMNMRCMNELKSFGVDELLRREYGGYLKARPEDGFDVSLEFDLDGIKGEDLETLIKKVSLLKRNALAAPFERAMDAQAAGSTTEIMRINYRSDGESMFIQALPDRVTVIFSTVFKEETDQIFGKVFLQEFVDARRQPSIQNAPQVLFSPKEPPLELRGLRNVVTSENIGYVTFVLFPRHFATPQLRNDCISRVQLFRDYLHYHIKCSKAYMHTRMRARVDSFLKVLNRAKPEVPDDKREKKTATGKTFKRN